MDSEVPLQLSRILVEAVERACLPDPAEWFTVALPGRQGAVDRNRFFAAFAGAGRRMKGRDINLDEHACTALRDAGVPAPAGWSAAQTARAALLISAMRVLPGDEGHGLAREVFDRGDNQEKKSLLVALCALPSPGSLLDIAVEACRTNVQDVFEAIACENGYPATYFDEASFNQMTVKALFIGVPVARIIGLDSRLNSELVRMVTNFVSERRAAGREVPEDAALIIGDVPVST